jgi:hypothetical protein
MHFIRGLNISKKIFKLLGKANYKAKLKPVSFIEYEREEEFIPYLNNYFQNKINLQICSFKQNLEKEKENIILKSKNFQYIIKNITLSVDKLFFLFFVMTRSSTSTNNSTNEKNINFNEHSNENALSQPPILGCQLKSNSQFRGMTIVLIKEDSHAEKADLRVNDTILKINEISINNIDEYKNAIMTGGKVKNFKISRIINNNRMELELKIEFDN